MSVLPTFSLVRSVSRVTDHLDGRLSIRKGPPLSFSPIHLLTLSTRPQNFPPPRLTFHDRRSSLTDPITFDRSKSRRNLITGVSSVTIDKAAIPTKITKIHGILRDSCNFSSPNASNFISHRTYFSFVYGLSSRVLYRSM